MIETRDSGANALNGTARKSGHISHNAQLWLVQRADGLAQCIDGATQVAHCRCNALQSGAYRVGAGANLAKSCSQASIHAGDGVVGIAQNATGWLCNAIERRIDGGRAKSFGDDCVDVADHACDALHRIVGLCNGGTHRGKRPSCNRLAAAGAAIACCARTCARAIASGAVTARVCTGVAARISVRITAGVARGVGVRGRSAAANNGAAGAIVRSARGIARSISSTIARPAIGLSTTTHNGAASGATAGGDIAATHAIRAKFCA